MSIYVLVLGMLPSALAAPAVPSVSMPVTGGESVRDDEGREDDQDDDEDRDDDRRSKSKSSRDEDDDDRRSKSKSSRNEDDDEDRDDDRRSKSKSSRDDDERLRRIDNKWGKVDARSQALYTTGSSMTSVGIVTRTLGQLIEEDALILTGGVFAGIGEPVMYGSAMRARRSIEERGQEVSGAAGYTAWAMWGSAIAFRVQAASMNLPSRALPYTITADVFELGSLVCVGLQASANAKGRERLDASSRADTDSPMLALTGFDVSPVEGGARLGLTGTF